MTGMPEVDELPEGRMVDLPGRGRTYLTDIPGPPGAPTLVLLHALACTGYLTWFPALAELSERYRVIVFDQRWHGRGIRTEPFSLADCADDVPAVLDAVGVDRALCAGYSMGGVVAQLAAHRHPDRVSGLVLCATAYRFQEKWRERGFHRAYGAMMDACSEYSYRRAERHAERLPALPDLAAARGGMDRWALGEFRSTSGWALAEAIAAVGRFDSESWLPTLDMPAAVVITTHDRALPVYRQLEMAKLIPGAEIFLARAGHASCVLRADAFVPVFLEACASVADRVTEVRSAAVGE